MDRTDEKISAGDLAFLGDAVTELLARRRVVGTARRPSDECVKYAMASAQSDALSRIEDVLTDEERDVYHRARNNYHTQNVPKSATPAQYRRATGFEAIFGWLYLKGDTARIEELFNLAYGQINGERKTDDD